MSTLPADFTHLHVHSHYTLLGGAPAPEALVERARADGLTSLALADGNALFGVVAFARACRAANIRPIIGLTAAVAPPPEDMPPDHGAALGRLVLLATGPAGYRSLCRLASLYQTDPDRERRARHGFRWDELREHTAGLIAVSGGRTCWLERYLRAGQPGAASRYVARLGGLYGEGCTLAVGPDLMIGELRAIADEIIALATRFGLHAAAVQPIFCLEPEERPLLRLLAAIDDNCPIDAVESARLPDGGDEATPLVWPDRAAFAGAYAARPELLAAAGQVAALCGEALPDGRPLWPSLDLASPADALRQQAAAGLAQRYGDPAPPDVVARLAHETAVITQFGFAPLFLVVADVVRFARASGIPAGTRGSVANSLAAYCLGITTVDPVAHDLLFERFLNPARRRPPDIDLDFCSRRRDEVLDYVRRTYGMERVALVSTMNTLQPRSAVRETGKAYGLSNETINALVAVLPRGWHPDPRRRSTETIDDVIAGIADPLSRDVVRQAYRLIGRPHHAGLHPGGLIITPGPLTDTVPLLLSPKGFLATQFEHGDVEAIGLPKLDLLGIRALTVLADAAALVQAHHALDFTLEAIPLDDAATGDLLARAETVGVFQCESTGAQRTLRQLKARTVQDLAVANAFFKPGPATGGMAQTFVRRYRGEEPTRYLHPALEPVLHTTKGVLIFQEQVLRIATAIAGLTWAEADHLRRGMSKFQPEEMTAMRARFVAGCCRPAPDGPGFAQGQAETLWQQVEAFAGYGFNQGHATAYADVSYRSAYLKAHWPAAFLCARLQDWGGFHHQAIYIAEAQRLGIAVRPPHVNRSGRKFTLSFDDDAPVLWMGLGQVRDLRRQAVAGIIAARRAQPFTGVRDLLLRVELQAKEVRHLIHCGAVDNGWRQPAAMLQAAGGCSPRRKDRPASDRPFPSWEMILLGRLERVHPLELARRRRTDVAIWRLPASRGQKVTVCAVRVPGWPGGAGFFMGDGDDFAIALAGTDAGRRAGALAVMAADAPERPVEDGRVGRRLVRDRSV
ncbi:MAG: DNA polymerase III subunit alpha [Candidatus Promineofilum sp.]|uniref:DNA polymerase III subunit alpha n=1 Tax=Promineifilum sp. TaxID=2664178 RepID=UPI002411A5CC|nr:DNA polymerase III subunit alpha [Promineifilum sp.]